MADAGWNPDPYGRHELRYFDGSTWTHNVSNGGIQNTDDPSAAPPPAVVPPMAAQQPRYAAQIQPTTPTIIVKHRSRWPWVVLGIFVVFGLGFVGCVAIIGTAIDHAAKDIGRQQEQHAISQGQFDLIQLGTPKAAVLTGLGKVPENTSSFSSQASSVTVQSDCIYYWETGHTFSSWYQFCFDATGNLRTKSKT